MKWLEKKTEKGILKYRMPNIQEGYSFLSLVERIESAQDLWKVKSKFLESMAGLIDFKSAGYATYFDFLEDKENNSELCSEICDEVFNDVTSLVKKKT
jgi:hypothetical protein